MAWDSPPMEGRAGDVVDVPPYVRLVYGAADGAFERATTANEAHVTAEQSGIVAFLFTDIEGSTRLWEADLRAMSAALARHDALLRAAIEAAGGRVFKTAGDAFCAVFASPAAAMAAAVAAQRTLADQSSQLSTPLRVRMAIHAGQAEMRDGDYFGPPLNRVARLLSTA